MSTGAVIPADVLAEHARWPEWRKHQYHWCRHFNGIQHGECEVGVVYKSVRTLRPEPVPPGQAGAMWPCMGYGLTHLNNCTQRAFLTDEEAQQAHEESESAITAWLAKLAGGYCPSCDAKVDQKRQVGPCVYAEPCGHRLYQGRV